MLLAINLHGIKQTDRCVILLDSKQSVYFHQGCQAKAQRQIKYATYLIDFVMHFQICFYFLGLLHTSLMLLLSEKGRIILAFYNIWKVFPDMAAKVEPTHD